MPSHGWLSEPAKLRSDCLPTKQHVCQHYLHLRKVNQDAGTWLPNTPLEVVLKQVQIDVKQLWDRTEIPHILSGRKGEKVLKILLKRFLSLTKIAPVKREDKIGQEFESLFDVSICQHSAEIFCTCPPENKVKNLGF